MEKLDFAAPFAVLVEMAGGECPTHGASETLIRRGSAWFCRTCHEASVAHAERERWLVERAAALIKIATVPPKYAGRRWPASTPEMREVRSQVRNFRDFVLAEPRWAVLAMTGKTGTGKTWLASEIAEAWVSRLSKSVRYITCKGMISEIQSSYGREGASEEGEILKFVQYDLLILDEIDAKPDKENANLLLTEIINRRYNENKPVVVITNQPIDKLAQFVGDRVNSRLHENAFFCNFDWSDFRLSGNG